MKAVIQRVKKASVAVEGETVGKVGAGFLVLLGVMDGDSKEDAEIMARKTANLRVFEDAEGKMNLDIKSIGGSVLAISQFTLCADVRKGNRPSFTPSAPPDKALELYDYYCEKLAELCPVQKGVFGADMQVELINDGPVTIIFDSEIWRKNK